MDIVYPFKVVSWDAKRASRTQITGWKTKSVQNHDLSAFWAHYPTKATNQKVQSAADLGMDGGSMFYLPRFPTHWHRNCRVPLSNEPHFFSCCAQYASSIFSSSWPNARKLAIPSWMVELVCVYCCTTSSFDSRVMPMRLSVLVEMVSMANEWTSLNSSNFKTTVTLCFCCKCTRLRRWFESNVT